MSGSRTKDYNQAQRAIIESLRVRIATFVEPENWRVVDTKLTKHTRPQFDIGKLNRFEIRSRRQVELYSFHVIER